MINVAAIRMQQFGVQFYQASLSASDIDKLVRFEVLNYGESGQQPVRGGKKRASPKVTTSKCCVSVGELKTIGRDRLPQDVPAGTAETGRFWSTSSIRPNSLASGGEKNRSRSIPFSISWIVRPVWLT